jgi:adenylyltransferase/sulfurtransferase
MSNSVMVPEITVNELKTLLASGTEVLLLDVRNDDEHQHANLGGRLIPLTNLLARLNELDPEQYTIVYCQSGQRSKYATALLLQHGFKQVSSLVGGFNAWVAMAAV